ncbi:MAG TPA: FkbM family methyltransferase [Pirellulales bacterium]|jgi:FkbM family methyltransferase|nr:FkbM family methyltransferase [Pirellulales bacterium]
MDLRALVRNVKYSIARCPRLCDRLRWLLWQYAKDGRSHRIRFRYGPPVGPIEVVVRSNRGSDGFIFGEVFDHRYYDFELPCPPTTILDLGSNIGLTAIYFGRKYPRASLACVEPVPANFACLQQNLRLNGIQARLYQAAIATEDGRLTMDLCDRDYGHAVSGYSSIAAQGRLEVPAIAVPTLMGDNGWTCIDLLKIDIEGYERELLTQRCDWLHRVNAIAIECHTGFGNAELEDLVQRFGFTDLRHLPGITLVLRDVRVD